MRICSMMIVGTTLMKIAAEAILVKKNKKNEMTKEASRKSICLVVVFLFAIGCLFTHTRTHTHTRKNIKMLSYTLSSPWRFFFIRPVNHALF